MSIRDGTAKLRDPTVKTVPAPRSRSAGACTLASQRDKPATARTRRRGVPPMAATNINRVVLTGNLTHDPELRSTSGGTPVCSLRIAVNTRRKDGSGNWIDKPNYFDVTVWGAQGENCAQYLAKGRPVAIDGRLEWREYQDR